MSMIICIDKVLIMTIGERIKKLREEKNMSVDKLAELIGKNRATIYRYESNDIEKLPTSVLEPLCKALGTTPAYLMGWDESDIDNKSKNSISTFILNDHEKQVILAYRSKPDMQNAVDTLLNVPALIEVKSVARSSDHHKQYNETITAKQLKLLQSQEQPTSDDDL